MKKNLLLLKDLFDLYNNAVHRTIRMKPIGVTFYSYAEQNEDSKEKDPKFQVDDHARISKYKNIFAEGYAQNWSEEVSIITKIKNRIPWIYVISELNGEPITGRFYEEELQKTSQEIFRIEKIIKRKSDNLHVNCKEYDNSFNSWINQKDLV